MAEHFAGERACRLAVLDYELAVHQEVIDAIIVLIPCRSLLSALGGSVTRGRELPPIMSMNPGDTMRPAASRTRFAWGG